MLLPFTAMLTFLLPFTVLVFPSLDAVQQPPRSLPDQSTRTEELRHMQKEQLVELALSLEESLHQSNQLVRALWNRLLEKKTGQPDVNMDIITAQPATSLQYNTAAVLEKNDPDEERPSVFEDGKDIYAALYTVRIYKKDADP
jgi:hypothetical protein